MEDAFGGGGKTRPLSAQDYGGGKRSQGAHVHKAKGLQFPVVILPFLKLSAFGTADMRDKGKFFVAGEDGLRLIHIKREYADYSRRLREIYREKEADYLFDEINNCYVACTRAEKELYIILTDSKRQRNHLIDHIFGLGAPAASTRGNVIEKAEVRGRGGACTDRAPRADVDLDPFDTGIERGRPRDEPISSGWGRWRGKFESPEGCSREQVWRRRKGT